MPRGNRSRPPAPRGRGTGERQTAVPGWETPRQISDRKANRIILLRTVFLLSVFGVLIFVPLFWKLYTIQIRDHEFYQAKAIDQQTMDNAVAASRGKITDCNGNVLALSATVYDVIISPADFVKLQKNWDAVHEKNAAKPGYPRPESAAVASELAAILGADQEKLAKQLEKTSSYYEVAAKRVEKEVADEVRRFVTDNHLSNSVYPSPTTKRYYPYGSLAAQVIGWVNPNQENRGAYGMEALYESSLAGETGRVVTAKDGRGTEMRFSFQDYYDSTDGSDLELTIDNTIQYFCERILEKGVEMFDVQNGGFVIAMEPKTGAIKAWANSPTYDLNDPWGITDPVLKAYLEKVKNDPGSNEEAYREALGQTQNRQWRNKAINDTYEPGSTFKSMVLAAALEEGVVSESSSFYCPGYATVDGWGKPIYCSKKTGHGSQDLATAVANSCNPAFIAIGQKLGAEKFYDYLEDFGFLEKTGIDMQGEQDTSALIWKRNKFTWVNLATASFGQRFNVTPIQLITAASAVVNGGHLMQPYVMRRITDSNGNIVKQNEPVEVRQVVSEQTSQRCRAILEKVVDGGTGKRAYAPGYRIGGKTGSSETLEKDHTIVSFLGFAPADDPQIVVLLMYDNPKPAYPGSPTTAKGDYISGGNMAAVMAGELIPQILDHLGVERVYSDDEKALIDMTVPNVVGQSAQVGQEAVQGAGFNVRVVGDGETVTGQLPAGGAVIPGGSEIVLYLGAEKPAGLVKVPDLRGQTAAGAQQTLARYGLYLKAGGDSRYMSSNAVVTRQTVSAGASVERGTVIECLFSDSTMVD